MRGVKVDAAQLAGGTILRARTATLALSTMEAKLLAADVSKQTHDSIVAQIDPRQCQQTGKQARAAKPPDASTIAGLLLGSPEFQRMIAELLASSSSEFSRS